MNLSAPDGSQADAQRSEGAMLRFLRWLLEPPVGPQSTGMRVLRWLLRASAWLLYAGFVGGDDGHCDGSGGRKSSKAGEKRS